MADHALNDVMATTMEKIKSMLDVNTIVGTPIQTPEGITLIPISKVSFGFASGGSDFGAKAGSQDVLFGGGTGAGANISPVAFLVVKGDSVRLLPVAPAPGSTAWHWLRRPLISDWNAISTWGRWTLKSRRPTLPV